MAHTLDLFSDFPPVTASDWLAKISQDLKGKALADLEWQVESIKVSPFPHLEDLKGMPAPLPTGTGWEIGEDIEAHDLLLANKQVRQALEMGVQAPRFIIVENLGDHRMASLLEGIHLPIVSVHFFEKNKNAAPRRLLEHFYHIARDTGQLEDGPLKGSVNWAYDDAVVMEDAFELVEYAQSKLPDFKVLPVNGHAYFGEGATVTELAHTIHRAVHWLDGLEEKGVQVAEANRFLFFSLSIGTNYFVEIAKLRALRLLWANVMRAYGVENAVMPFVETHLSPGTQAGNQHDNMIKATVQAMSAIIGGADRLTVLPSDAFTGRATDFSRRIARNVQHILSLESHFDWVADPAAGSYFIESLTEKLATAAWKVFQEL